MGAALKKPRAAVGAAAAVAEALLERRGPAVTRRLTARERHVETGAAGLLLLTAAAMAVVADADGDISTAVLLTFAVPRVDRPSWAQPEPVGDDEALPEM